MKTKISIREKREIVTRMLQGGDLGVLRLGLSAADAFEKGPKTAAKQMRQLIPLEHYPIVLAIMVRKLYKQIGVASFFKCFPEHHELLFGIVACCINRR